MVMEIEMEMEMEIDHVVKRYLVLLVFRQYMDMDIEFLCNGDGLGIPLLFVQNWGMGIGMGMGMVTIFKNAVLWKTMTWRTSAIAVLDAVSV